MAEQNIHNETLLWINEDPTVAFGQQTLYLDLSKYQMIRVEWYLDTTGYGIAYYNIGYKYRFMSATNLTTNNSPVRVRWRDITVNIDSIDFSNAILKNVNTSSGTTQNTQVVPAYIYAS